MNDTKPRVPIFERLRASAGRSCLGLRPRVGAQALGPLYQTRLMVDVVGQWMPVQYDSVYHGKSQGSDGTVWVYPRVHSSGGPFVEVHLDSPDGRTIRRSAVSHLAEAATVVQHLRDLAARHGVAAIPPDIDPLVPRGSVVVHASSWDRYRTGYARLNDGAETRLCARLWAGPGRHRIAAGWVSHRLDDRSVPASADEMDIVIEPDAIIDVRLRMWPGDDLVRGRRLVHSCQTPGVPLVSTTARRTAEATTAI